MKKLWRSRKALSPVVAAIILIAVTVAVSIAVAAWMGALTFTFMGYESVEIQTIAWNSDMSGFTIGITNDGTKDLTVHHIEVNYQTRPSDLVAGTTLATGATMDIAVTFTYVNGTAYDIAVVTSTGQEFTDHFTGGQAVS
jgi:flagellin-like protein